MTTADPWYYGGNWNRPYVYARNNPLRFVDPSGLTVTVIPTTPEWIKICEDECAAKGMVTVGPVTYRHDYYLFGCYFGWQDTKCNCRPAPKNSGSCTPQELSYLQVAKDVACSGAGKPAPRQSCEKLAALALANAAAPRELPSKRNAFRANPIKYTRGW